jgi:cob(I)alamin adenosyltransferase
VAIHFKLLTLGQLLNFLTSKPPSIELVLTGQRAPKQLLEKADLVNEMIEVKHYYRQNIMARNGIERVIPQLRVNKAY